MDRDLVSKADLQQMLSVSADIMATIRTLTVLSSIGFGMVTWMPSQLRQELRHP
jgi:hypothetical protein